MSEPPEVQELNTRIDTLTKGIALLLSARNRYDSRLADLKAKSFPLDEDKLKESLVSHVQEECKRAGLDEGLGIFILNLLLARPKESLPIAALQQVTRPPTVEPQVVKTQTQSSTPLEVFTKAKELERSGKKLIRLDIGEPDFRPPKAVVDEVIKAVSSARTHYTEPRGIPELISAIQAYLLKKNNFKVEDKQIIVTPGGKYAIYLALATLLEKGGDCMIVDPSWPAYREAITYLGKKAIVIPTKLEDKWEPSLDVIQNSMTPNTKVLVLNYPSNPTGKIIKPESFYQLVKLANDKGLTVISDEIYNDYAYSECPTILKSESTNFVYGTSFSKAWAMTGFRLGYAVASEEVVAKMALQQALMVTCVPEFLQLAAIKALESEKEVKENSMTMKKRIDAACKALDQIKALEYHRPDGAMYIFPRLKSTDVDYTPEAFGTRLLQEMDVTVTPGTAFGDYPDFFRISLGNSEKTVLEGIRRMGATLR
jgi:aspartate aminotransferase